MELLEEIESLGDFVIEPLNLDASQTRDLFAAKYAADSRGSLRSFGGQSAPASG
jgi:hypothetical protein